MNLQYILDSKGETTGVFIPIKEWLSFKKKFKGIESEITEIPDWHKQEIDRRLESITDCRTELLDFEATIDELDKDL
ncbi:addiction module protein [Flavobacterium sp. D11R37]|uniref:addiction module protein n=1 Tax=Flavobacterium coralii TaxID=2838017 RepID=UPI001CA5FDF7|nr:addiction module protein [Flavobacterium coralii]MBY8962445.1 addiction module protein [Flavobacterium coralii]